LDQQQEWIMLNTRAQAHGFSIIELMIAVAVLAIMLLLGMPAMGTWLGNASIRTNAEAISNAVQFARTDAIRRNASVRITMNAAGTSWTINTVSDGAVVQERNAEANASNVAVTFEPAASRTITFSGLGAITDDTAVRITAIKVDSATMTAAQSREMCIMIAASGIARMCDPQRSTANLEASGSTKVTTDPMSCQPAVPAVCL
jgi:type IV fimbrial biogenesis protein FimT